MSTPVHNGAWRRRRRRRRPPPPPLISSTHIMRFFCLFCMRTHPCRGGKGLLEWLIVRRNSVIWWIHIAACVALLWCGGVSSRKWTPITLDEANCSDACVCVCDSACGAASKLIQMSGSLSRVSFALTAWISPLCAAAQVIIFASFFTSMIMNWKLWLYKEIGFAEA